MSSKATISAAQAAKVAPAVAPKAVPPASKPIKPVTEDKQSASGKGGKMHKRSRSGCFTCRLRRKKCNEEKPCCRACRHLGLKCEYKRPVWWSNAEQRKAEKENIKDVIKNTKMSEKAAQRGTSGGSSDSPPGLTHSLPTSAIIPDAARFTRAGSQDSYDSLDFNQPVGPDLYNPHVYTPQFDAQFDAGQQSHQQLHQNSYGGFSQTPIPYEVDVKTERQMFVNDIPTRTDTTISTFSTYHLPPQFQSSHPHDALHAVPEENWLHEGVYEDPSDLFATTVPALSSSSSVTHPAGGSGAGGADSTASTIGFADEDPDFAVFDFSRASAPPSHQSSISVDEADRPLLDHFIDNVLPLIFPILEANQPGLARSELILPALESNKTYLHCCLSAAAVHMKFTRGLAAPDTLDNDIIRHRFATINELCESFKRNIDHSHILDATLALIFFQSATGHPDDTSPDIPWHQHFVGAADLVRRLGFDLAISQPAPGEDPLAPVHPPFSMSLAAWIDILGSTMLGRAPVFADAYRDSHLAGRPLGLGALMGCDDSMMVMISEIACLEALKIDHTLDEVDLCNHITMLAQQMDLSEMPPEGLVYPYNPETGSLRPRQLGRNVTALFLKAARIWLQSLVPGASRQADTMQTSLAQFSDLLDLVPGGPHGFDRSLVWPIFVAGIQTTRGGLLRNKIESRWNGMGESRDLGTFGRMVRLLREVWRRGDEIDMRNSTIAAAAGSSVAAAGTDGEGGESTTRPLLPDVHWRDVMRDCRLEFLPI